MGWSLYGSASRSQSGRHSEQDSILGAGNRGKQKRCYVKTGGRELKEEGLQGGGEGTDTKTRQRS